MISANAADRVAAGVFGVVSLSSHESGFQGFGSNSRAFAQAYGAHADVQTSRMKAPASIVRGRRARCPSRVARGRIRSAPHSEHRVAPEGNPNKSNPHLRHSG